MSGYFASTGALLTIIAATRGEYPAAAGLGLMAVVFGLLYIGDSIRDASKRIEKRARSPR